MKLLLFGLYILFFLSCYASQGNENKLLQSPHDNYQLVDSSKFLRVIKIDSTANIYIILAQKNELKYKIVSFKDSFNCSSRIKIGQYYNMEIKSVFPENYFQKNRIHFVRYGEVNVPLGESKEIVWDLFSALNLKGLCIL